jgi:hypothetical protein
MYAVSHSLFINYAGKIPIFKWGMKGVLLLAFPVAVVDNPQHIVDCTRRKNPVVNSVLYQRNIGGCPEKAFRAENIQGEPSFRF